MTRPEMAELALEWLRLDQDESTRTEIQELLEKQDSKSLEDRLSKSAYLVQW